jgi:hypothetical protein
MPIGENDKRKVSEAYGAVDDLLDTDEKAQGLNQCDLRVWDRWQLFWRDKSKSIWIEVGRRAHRC